MNNNSQFPIWLFLLGVLQCAFIVLDAGGVVSWPWYKVASPLLAYLTMVFVAILVLAVNHIRIERAFKKKKENNG